MADFAGVQVEELLRQTLQTFAPLSAFTIMTDPSGDEDLAENTITITTVGVAQRTEFGSMDETWHDARVRFSVVSGVNTPGQISRNNQRTLAHVHSALVADRTLGGLIFGIEPVDMAASMDGRDIGDANLDTTVTFRTSRDDWFTLLTN